MSGGGVRSVPARPDGDSMAKLIMMRRVLGIAAVSAAVLVVAIAWQSASSGVGRVSSAASAADQSDFARRRDELRFLQAAFDRLDAESRQDPNGPALPSLRAEQDAIVLQMREVARPLPADSLPPALRHLATAEPRSAAEPALPANPAQASASPAASPIPVAASRELRAGLGAASSVPDLALSRDPALNLVILIAKPRAPRPTNEAAPDHSAEAPANPEARAAAKARAAQRAERAAERAAARPPAAGTAGFIERLISEPATAAR